MKKLSELMSYITIDKEVSNEGMRNLKIDFLTFIF